MTGLSRRDGRVLEKDGGYRLQQMTRGVEVRAERDTALRRMSFPRTDRSTLWSRSCCGEASLNLDQLICASHSRSHVTHFLSLSSCNNGPRQGCEGGLRLQSPWRLCFRDQPCNPRCAGAYNTTSFPLAFCADFCCSPHCFCGPSFKSAKSSSLPTPSPHALPISSSIALPSSSPSPYTRILRCSSMAS